MSLSTVFTHFYAPVYFWLNPVFICTLYYNVMSLHPWIAGIFGFYLFEKHILLKAASDKIDKTAIKYTVKQKQ